MKSDDNESGSKDSSKENDDAKQTSENNQDPQPSSSKVITSPSSPDSQTKDKLFEPTVDMLVNDFDEEQTLEEEEALAAKEEQDPGQELSDLQRESEMPIEELLKLYGCAPPAVTESSSRKRRRRQDRSSPSKKVAQENPNESNTAQTAAAPSTTAEAEVAEEEDEEDAATTTTNTNNLENQSLDDETNYDDDEPSELKKLYEREDKVGEMKLDGTFSDEEDFDYVPEEDEDGKKTIMVGADHQASIPEGLLQYDDALPYENEDKLLWDPSKLSDGDIEDYLQKYKSPTNGSINHTSPVKHLRDDELALLLLVQCGNNREEALRRRRLGSVQPATTVSVFSDEECLNFESGLRLFGKSFHEIQASKVKTRSVGELVEFYYLWKKTDRADAFINKSRMEKKKNTLNPCVTDLMEKYLEEYDNNGGGVTTRSERDRSVSPNVNNSNSLLFADAKRHRNEASCSSNNNQLSPEHKLSKQVEDKDNSVIKNE